MSWFNKEKKPKKPSVWQWIEKESMKDTARMKVYGGWLVRERVFESGVYGDQCSVALQYISDPDHRWRHE